MTLEQIASELVFVDSSDKEACSRIINCLLEFADNTNLPAAIRATAESAAETAQAHIDNNDGEQALKQLSDAIDRLQQQEELASEGGSAGSVDADLLHEFIGTQASVLAEFESACLRLDAGQSDALPALRRQIHTWKGEAGVLGLVDLNANLHAVEEQIEHASHLTPTQIADALFALKDSLQTFFEHVEKDPSLCCDLSAVVQQLTASSPPSPQPSTSQVAQNPATAALPSAQAEPARTFVLPDDMDMDLVHEFQTESAEHFQNAEVALMNLDSDPSDAEAVNVVFRAFHTVKGVSSFVGTTYITELAHKAETFLDRFRKGTLVMQGAYTDLAFASLDLLKKLLAALGDAIAVRKWDSTAEYRELIQRLDHCDDLVALPAAVAPAVPNPGKKVGEILISEGKTSPAAVQEALELQAAGDARPVGQILVEQSSAKAQDVTQAIRSQQPAAANKESEPDATVKVSTQRLDNLINMVGELVIAQSMVSQDPSLARAADQRLLRNMSQLGKITRSMQELALSMRMITVKGTFQKMARLVRDLARKSKKEISFEMSGEETELDRNMVEAIADPLVHMIRNSCDHGVETPEERAQAGKPRAGTVRLSASYEGGSVMIKIQDDGRGLNTDKIRRKAIERELIEPNAQLSEREIHNLIWLPGFSTADKITDVSGRGVGMDVVRTNIEALRGSVDIQSTWGEGTTFVIRLPLTLAIIDGMVARVGAERFIVPITAITESYRPQPKDLSTIAGKQELILLRGELLAVSRLSSLFALESGARDLTQGTMLVLETKNGKRFALHVDELLGQQQVVIKSLGDLFQTVQGLSGGAILGDGRVCLIVDVEGLARLTPELKPSADIKMTASA